MGGETLEYSKIDLIIYYLILINLISFLTFALDKNRARKNKWRTPEKSLMTLSIMGGSLGSLIGVYLMKHKTQRKKFTLGIPIILLIQAILVGLCKFYRLL